MEARGQVKPYLLETQSGKVLPNIGVLKASALQTNGAFEILEYAGPASPPPHIHRQREEAFYVLEGSFRFVLSQEMIEAGPGAFIFIPRGTRHGFTISPGARALLFIAPAGLEGFFQELGEGLQAGRPNDEIRAALAGKYDSEPV